jgi:hypothetical protein
MGLFGCRHNWLLIVNCCRKDRRFYLVDEKCKRTSKPFLEIEEYICSKCGKKKIVNNIKTEVDI